MSSKNFNSFKDFQSDQIETSSRKLFTAHYASKRLLSNNQFINRNNQFINRILEPVLTVIRCSRERKM